MPKDSQLDVPDDISEDEVFPPLSPSPSRWGAERDGEHLMNGENLHMKLMHHGPELELDDGNES